MYNARQTADNTQNEQMQFEAIEIHIVRWQLEWQGKVIVVFHF